MSEGHIAYAVHALSEGQSMHLKHVYLSEGQIHMQHMFCPKDKTCAFVHLSEGQMHEAYAIAKQLHTLSMCFKLCLKHMLHA